MFRSVKFILLAMIPVISWLQAEASDQSQVAASGRIAVVNSQMALLESTAARQYARVSERQFGEQVKMLKELESQYKTLVSKLEKDGLVLSEAERTKLQTEMRRKKDDWEYQARQLQIEKNEADQKELAKLQPQLEEAIRAVAETEGYDIVIERAATRFVKLENDVTRKVIDRLNRLTAKQK